MKAIKPLLFASALAFALGVQAQGMGNSTYGNGSSASSPSSSSSTSSMSGSTASAMDDKTFATHAAQVGQAEVQMGKLAEKRASDPAVKDYAKQLVKEHTNNNKQLEKVAKSEKIKLPKKLSSDDKKTYDELSKLSGSQFDQRFIEAQVQDHQKAIDLFQNEANNGKGKMQSYAQTTLPHLQAHLDSANRLATKVGASSTGSAGSAAAGGSSGSNSNFGTGSNPGSTSGK